MDDSALRMASDLVIDWMGILAFLNYLTSPLVYSVIYSLIE